MIKFVKIMSKILIDYRLFYNIYNIEKHFKIVKLLMILKKLIGNIFKIFMGKSMLIIYKIYGLKIIKIFGLDIMILIIINLLLGLLGLLLKRHVYHQKKLLKMNGGILLVLLDLLDIMLVLRKIKFKVFVLLIMLLLLLNI